MPFDFGNMALAAMDAQKDYAATQEKLRAKAEEESLARDKLALDKDRYAQEQDMTRQKMALDRERFDQEKLVFQGNEKLRAANQKAAEALANEATLKAEEQARVRNITAGNRAVLSGNYDSDAAKSILGNAKPSQIGTHTFEVTMDKDPLNGVPQSSSGVMYIDDESKPPMVIFDDELAGAKRLLLPTDNPDEIEEKLSKEGLPLETIGLAILLQTAEQKKSGILPSAATKANTQRALQAAINGRVDQIKELQQAIKDTEAAKGKMELKLGKDATERVIAGRPAAENENNILAGRLAILLADDKTKDGPEAKKIESEQTAIKKYIADLDAHDAVIKQNKDLLTNTNQVLNTLQTKNEAGLLGKPGAPVKPPSAKTEPPPAPANPTPADNFKILRDRTTDPATRQALDDAAASGLPLTEVRVAELSQAAQKGAAAVKALIKPEKTATDNAGKSSTPTILRMVSTLGNEVINTITSATPPMTGDLMAAGIPYTSPTEIANFWALTNRVEDRTLREGLMSALNSRSPERTKDALLELEKRFPSEMPSVKSIYARERPSGLPGFWKKP